MGTKTVIGLHAFFLSMLRRPSSYAVLITSTIINPNTSMPINAGVDVKTVSSSLGYSETLTTLNLYPHSFQEAQARASETMADTLNLKRRNKAGALFTEAPALAIDELKT